MGGSFRWHKLRIATFFDGVGKKHREVSWRRAISLLQGIPVVGGRLLNLPKYICRRNLRYSAAYFVTGGVRLPRGVKTV
jgi:hypothetical protein